MASPFKWKDVAAGWNRFWFETCDMTIFGIIRICFACLLLINVALWGPYLELWFGDLGFLPLETSRAMAGQGQWTVFSLLPKEVWVLWGAYSLLLLHIFLLLLGVFSRFQMVFIFIWLVSFQHRNPILNDGEDSVFRLLVFYLIFCPLDTSFSLRNRLAGKKSPRFRKALYLRLIQIQMTAIYLSTVWEKLNGYDWYHGHAVYYVTHLTALYGKFPLPEFLTESLFASQLLSWSVLFLELAIPFGLWFRETRQAALIAAFALHLSLEYSMNLFLFQWVMMVGLLSFLEIEKFKLFSNKYPVKEAFS